MQAYTSLLLILLVSFCNAQNEIDSSVYHYYHNTPGIHDVFYNIEYYKNGNIKEQGWIVSIDKDHDLVDVPDNFENTVIKIEVGVYKRYYENGEISLIKTVNLNKTDSISIKNFLANGTLDSEWIFPHQKISDYPNNRFKGPLTYYQKNYKNGILFNEGLWIVGLYSVGQWVWYNQDGSIKGIIDYGEGGSKMNKKFKKQVKQLSE